MKYKSKVCLCTLGKQENRYIREFVSYYKKLGVDKIYLYDNNNYLDEMGQAIQNLSGNRYPTAKVVHFCLLSKRINTFNIIIFFVKETKIVWIYQCFFVPLHQ